MRFLRVIIIAVLLISLAANFIMYAKYRGRRAIFSVNGQGVSKNDMDDYLEQQAGPNTKAVIVQRMLIEQEAKKEGVAPTEQEVDDAYKEAKQNWQFAQRVNSNPWLAGEAKAELRQGMEKARLQAKSATPATDEEIKEEYSRHPQQYDTPNQAHAALALVHDGTHLNEIKQLMDNGVDPTVIMRQYPWTNGGVVFLGDQNKFTFQQPLGNTKTNSIIFTMKPNQVKVLQPQEFVRLGAKVLVVRLIDIVPGHKADLNDPKTRQKLQIAVELQRSKPWQEILSTLWANTDFKSEDPNDKQYIERLFFPDRARAEAH